MLKLLLIPNCEKINETPVNQAGLRIQWLEMLQETLVAHPSTWSTYAIGSGPFAALGWAKSSCGNNFSTKSPPPWPFSFSVVPSPKIATLSHLLLPPTATIIWLLPQTGGKSAHKHLACHCMAHHHPITVIVVIVIIIHNCHWSFSLPSSLPHSSTSLSLSSLTSSQSWFWWWRCHFYHRRCYHRWWRQNHRGRYRCLQRSTCLYTWIQSEIISATLWAHHCLWHRHRRVCGGKSAEILGDPYSKKSPLPSIDTSPRLAVSPKDPSYRLLGQSRIHHRHNIRNNHTRILAQ